MSVATIVTERIVEEMSKGQIPWHKPWKSLNPSNAASGRPYRGVNRFLLGLSNFSDNRWLTYKQAVEKGGFVKKGEHGSMVVFYKMTDEETGEEVTRGDSRPENVRVILRYSTVFNVEQCEGLKLPALVENDF